MPRQRYSIARARDQLARLVHEAEKGKPVELTRRGHPVAVLVSAAEYSRLSSARPGFWAALTSFRKRFDVDRTGLTEAEFDPDGLRDRSAGGEFAW